MQVSIKTLFLLLCMAILPAAAAPLSGNTGKWAGHKESGQASYYADKFQNQDASASRTRPI